MSFAIRFTAVNDVDFSALFLLYPSGIVKFVLRDSAPLIRATTREIAARIAHASVAACLTTLPT